MELFRVKVYDKDDKVVEVTEETEYYTGAHLTTFNYDPDYPSLCAVVERTQDGSTWESYDASELIDGAPAWVHHLKKWQEYLKDFK